jgi:hypothetical protein
VQSRYDVGMPCLLAILALAFPRVVLLLLWLFTTYLERAINSVLVLLIGFLILPLTTLAYAFTINTHGTVDGLYLVLIVVAVLIDLGLIGGGHASRRRAD